MNQKGIITNNGDSITITLQDGTEIIVPYTGDDLPDGTEVNVKLTNPPTVNLP